MKIVGEVGKLETTGDYVLITLVNVRGEHDSEFSDYWPSITLRVGYQRSKSYQVGRRVELMAVPK